MPHLMEQHIAKEKKHWTELMAAPWNMTNPYAFLLRGRKYCKSAKEMLWEFPYVQSSGKTLGVPYGITNVQFQTISTFQ